MCVCICISAYIQVMQHVRITYSSKIGCHSALGVSVSSNPVLKELMGVSTKLLKPHVLNQGGIVSGISSL